MDPFSFLHKEPKPVARVGDPAPDPLVVRKCKIDKNWNNWLMSYIIYMSIVLQMQPAKASPLLKIWT